MGFRVLFEGLGLGFRGNLGGFRVVGRFGVEGLGLLSLGPGKGSTKTLPLNHGTSHDGSVAAYFSRVLGFCV